VTDRTARSVPAIAAREKSARPAIGARVVIENLQPSIDGGRFPIKRTQDESVSVTADVFADGHDLLAGVLKCRSGSEWTETPLTAGADDSWGASFAPGQPGEYEYTVEAWIDRFATWLRDLIAKAEAGQDVAS
jgi:starch synthase (maltosyl-transferring)